MQRYFDQIDALSDIGAVLKNARDRCYGQGIVRMSYHMTSAFDDPVSQTTTVYASGFSKEWLAKYEREAFRAADPIPRRVLHHGSMMTWADAMVSEPNTRENEEYFAAMAEEGLVHGIGVPLFGPGGRDGYAGIDFGKPISEVEPDLLGVVRTLAQAEHQRICVLIEQQTDVPVLSEREMQVLTWTARGKSVSSIAAILDLSPDTVKTYSKRIYSKLDVSDRVGAVVKALQMGLVRV